jgi:hypothetical protein
MVEAPPERAHVSGWFVCHHAPGRHRGRSAGVLAGLDAALVLLRDPLQLELLLLPDTGRAAARTALFDPESLRRAAIRTFGACRGTRPPENATP